MRNKCEEWTEMKDGEEMLFDNHEWQEVENNARIQILRCAICKKHSSARHSDLEEFGVDPLEE